MRKSAFIILIAASIVVSNAETLPITLDDAIVRARTGSVEAAAALDELRSAYWEYRTYRADLLPELTFDATLPSYRKDYSTYQNSDGSYSFVRNNLLQLNGQLSVSQNIWLTGGTLSLSTSLDFLRQLDDTHFNRFMSVPVALTLNQPVFGTNHTKWHRRIEPVRYEEAKARFISATEEVALKAVNCFFSLLLAKEQLGTSRQNLDNADKLHKVAKAKREMGQISQNDLLQMELNVLQAKSELTDAESNYRAQMFQLRSFLGIEGDEELDPVLPGSLPAAGLSYEIVLEKALERNQFARNIRRRQLEADYEVAKAKGAQREIKLFAQVGFTGTADAFRGAYSPLKDNQVVQLGVSVPLVDWGKRRGKVRVAESNRDLTATRIRQEEQNFRQDIFLLVERYNNQLGQLRIAAESDTIAQRRWATNVETFMIGKISTLDLNDSQERKDRMRQDYINQLFAFWSYYYQLRSLTLWDFTTSHPIDADIAKLVRR